MPRIFLPNDQTTLFTPKDILAEMYFVRKLVGRFDKIPKMCKFSRLIRFFWEEGCFFKFNSFSQRNFAREIEECFRFAELLGCSREAN